MKVSSLKKSRIRTSFVDKNTNINKTSAVESVTSISSIQNSSHYSSENHLIFYDKFYDNLKELKKEYKKFYGHQQALEYTIHNFDKNKDKLLHNIKDLIIKYNSAIKSLSSFDSVFGTNYVKGIEKILMEYNNKLENLGIHIIEGNKLKLQEDIFMSVIKNNENAVEFLFTPAKGLILKIYTAFRNIKIPKKKALEKKYENTNYTGMLLDNKT